MGYCIHCGFALPDGAAFCSDCGQPVASTHSDVEGIRPAEDLAAGSVLSPAGSVDPLSALGDQIRTVPWAMLVPLRSWWLDGAWRRGWVGLFSLFAVAPFFLLRLTADDQDIHRIAWGFALYFALLWFVVLYSLIRPGQLNWWVLARVAVFTAAAGTAIAIFLEKRLAPDDTNLMRMIVGVGLPEELAKALAVYLFVFRAKALSSTRTYLFAGAVSGLAFGAAEAVSYSEKYASLAQYLTPSAFTAVVTWRLLTDALLHATLAGIAAYFLGLACRYRQARWPLVTAGLVLAAVLHGAYDSLASGWPGTVMAAVIVFIFAGYVRSGDAIAERLTSSAHSAPTATR